MRPRGVVVVSPSSDDLASLIEIDGEAFVEKLVTPSTVEGFNITVLHGPTGCDIVPFDLIVLCPAQDRIAGELGAIIEVCLDVR